MDNGGCGYVLKPEFLLPKGGVETVTFNPELATTPKQRLRVEVNEGRKEGRKEGKGNQVCLYLISLSLTTAITPHRYLSSLTTIGN